MPVIIKLTEVFKADRDSLAPSTKSRYTLREVFINPEHVVCLREDLTLKRLLEEGVMDDKLDQRQTFTKIHLQRGHSGIDITVVGAPVMIQEQLFKSTKNLLKG